MKEPEDFDATMKRLLDDGQVGPLLREFCSGQMKALEARRALLDQTIAHVEALRLIDQFDEKAIAPAPQPVLEIPASAGGSPP
jgi:hypothetical protein